jgi:transcriptional regulator with XRE-family HTH domain
MVQIPRLREWREARALTQVELADRAGVSSRSVAGYEAGTGARPPTVRKLAKALEVDIADLVGDVPRPKVLRPKSLDQLLDRAGLETRWLTLPYEEFEAWWRSVDYEEAKRRFWQIHEEYFAFRAEAEAIARGESRVAPELERQMGIIGPDAWRRHFHALAAAPSTKESEADFYERQERGDLRQFEPAERETPAEELIARAV